jgi:hypothetical protein
MKCHGWNPGDPRKLALVSSPDRGSSSDECFAPCVPHLMLQRDNSGLPPGMSEKHEGDSRPAPGSKPQWKSAG